MAEGHDDGSIAPRRSLSGPIMPPPPPELAADAAKAGRSARPSDSRKAAADTVAVQRAEAAKRAATSPQSGDAAAGAPTQEGRPVRAPKVPRGLGGSGKAKQGAPKQGAPRRTRRAQLRLVQVDAWSVMKTSFLLSIALGIVLVVAVGIVMSVLGAAGVWDSINSIVQQAVGSDTSTPFDIQEYVGTSRILGFTMIVAVLDVILITAIATLGAFLYNLSAALLGGIEVTLAEDN